MLVMPQPTPVAKQRRVTNRGRLSTAPKQAETTKMAKPTIMTVFLFILSHRMPARMPKGRPTSAGPVMAKLMSASDWPANAS